MYIENIEFVKRDLKTRLPNIRPTHLTEALAAAAGYKTYAALLADTKGLPSRHPPLRQISHDRFVERMKSLGYSDHDFSFSQTIYSGNLPTPCWRQFPSKDLDSNNSWFDHCQRLGIPNVYIQSRRKYVKLCWDCISIRPEHETTIKDDCGKKLRVMYAKYRSTVGPNALGKPLFSGSPFAGSVDNIGPEPAIKLADELFETLYLAMDP
jgi:hypothetical protein